MHASYAIVLAAAACVSAQINIGFNPVQNNEQTNNINVGAPAPPVAPVAPIVPPPITTAPGPVTTAIAPPNNTEPVYPGYPADEAIVDCVITHIGPPNTSTCTTTSTYCPICDSGDEYTTTYETAYKAFCPTGYTSKTYQVTETCSGPYTAPTGVPSGFVETVSVCHSCGTAPITATLTCPVSTGPAVYTTPTAPVVVEACPTCTEVVSGTGAVYPTGVKTFTGAASSFSASFACGASFLAVLAGMLLL